MQIQWQIRLATIVAVSYCDRQQSQETQFQVALGVDNDWFKSDNSRKDCNIIFSPIYREKVSTLNANN